MNLVSLYILFMLLLAGVCLEGIRRLVRRDRIARGLTINFVRARK